MPNQQSRVALDQLIDCCRLLVVAWHDARARDGGWISPSILSFLRQKSDIGAGTWQAFLESLASTGGVTLLPRGDGADATVQLRRNLGHFSPTLSVLLEMVAPRDVPKGVIEDTHRANLRKLYGIADSGEFFDFSTRFIDALSDRIGQKITRSNLKGTVRDFENWEAWGDGLIEVLESISVIRPSELPADEPDIPPPDTYDLVEKADHSRVINHIFGRSTGVTGLDRLLFGGYYVPPGSDSHGLTIVISGSPGLGKSTLGMSLAAVAAARGAAAYYVSLESSFVALQRQLTTYFRGHRAWFDVVAMTQENLTESRAFIAAASTLYISDVFTSPRDVNDLSTSLSDVGKNSPSIERVVVIDSLTAIKRTAGEPWRDQLAAISTALQARGFTVVLIFERDTPDAFAAEDYVADLSFHVDSNTGVDIGYSQRTIEIVKSRWQFSNRGRHFFTIRAGRGPVVSPSSAASLTMQRRSEAPVPSGPHKGIDLKVDGFAKLLGSNVPPPPEISAPVPWWTEGSVTLLVGQPGSLHHRFAQAFCEVDRSPSTSESDGACVLVVHFGSEFPQQWLINGSYEIARSGVGIRYRSWGGGALVHYYLFRGSYLAAGQILDELRDFLNEQQRLRNKVRRAVVGDFANLESQFPFLRGDPLFATTLTDLLMDFDFTSTMVYTQSQFSKKDDLFQQLRSLAQNVLRFQAQPGYGKEVFRLVVESSSTNAHYSGPVELIQDGGSLAVRDSLDLEGVDGSVIQVFIRLYGGTDIQRRHNKEIAGGILKPFHVEPAEPGPSLSWPGFRYSRPARSKEIRLAMVESHVVYDEESRKRSAEKVYSSGILIEPLQHLWLSNDDRKSLLGELHFQGSFLSAGAPDRIRSIPYFLNPSLLVVRAELHEFLGKWVPDWIGPSGEIEVPSWQALLDAVCRAQAVTGSPLQGLNPVSYWGESFETINCLLFEVLYSFAGGAELVYRLCDSFGAIPDFSDEEWGIVAGAIDIMRQVRLVKWNKADLGNSVCWRLWYSGFRQLLEDSHLPFRILRLPGAVSTNGDWHLSILSGSAPARAGIDIIRRDLVTRDHAMTLMNVGVGLSPFRSFYDKRGKLPVSQVAPVWFRPYVLGEKVVYRARLPRYISYAKVLGFHIHAIANSVSGDEVSPQKVRESLMSMYQIVRRNDDV